MRSKSEMNIIRMAEEAGFGANQRATLRLKLQRFAALVAAAEREACAKVCEAQIQEWVDDRPRYAASECAVAIRSRGEK